MIDYPKKLGNRPFDKHCQTCEFYQLSADSVPCTNCIKRGADIEWRVSMKFWTPDPKIGLAIYGGFYD